MAITSAAQRGGIISVYDEKYRFLCQVSGELQDFTSSTVSIRKGNVISVYDERGRFLSQHSAEANL